MSPDDRSQFWSTWRCRRNANYFLLSLAGCSALFIVGTILHNTELDQYVVPALPAPGLLLVVWMVRCLRRARSRRRERLNISPLSRDELRVARSKLMQYRKAKSL